MVVGVMVVVEVRGYRVLEELLRYDANDGMVYGHGRWEVCCGGRLVGLVGCVHGDIVDHVTVWRLENIFRNGRKILVVFHYCYVKEMRGLNGKNNKEKTLCFKFLLFLILIFYERERGG